MENHERISGRPRRGNDPGRRGPKTSPKRTPGGGKRAPRGTSGDPLAPPRGPVRSKRVHVGDRWVHRDPRGVPQGASGASPGRHGSGSSLGKTCIPAFGAKTGHGASGASVFHPFVVFHRSLGGVSATGVGTLQAARVQRHAAQARWRTKVPKGHCGGRRPRRRTSLAGEKQVVFVNGPLAPFAAQRPTGSPLDPSNASRGAHGRPERTPLRVPRGGQSPGDAPRSPS